MFFTSKWGRNSLGIQWECIQGYNWTILHVSPAILESSFIQLGSYLIQEPGKLLWEGSHPLVALIYKKKKSNCFVTNGDSREWGRGCRKLSFCLFLLYKMPPPSTDRIESDRLDTSAEIFIIYQFKLYRIFNNFPYIYFVFPVVKL